MKGKFVVIEGGDATGKATQVKLLQEYLSKAGYGVVTLDFPRYYDNFWGKMVGTYLKGEFGGLYENNPYLSTLPYILDQSDAKGSIKKALKSGKFVLTNRYISSQVHQCSKLPLDARDKYMDWLEEAAYRKLKAVRADMVIVLHVPSEKSEILNKKKKSRGYTNGEVADIAEADLKHQQVARKEYKRWVSKYDNWELVVCTDKTGELRNPEEIHNEILKILEAKSVLAKIVTEPQVKMFHAS